MPNPVPDDRLDSWKEIAGFLKRGVRTVQRWEREEGLPVHRHQHRKLGSVFALQSEVGAWWESRRRSLEAGEKKEGRHLKLLVLPFQNLSGDPGQDYLSDGFTEEMITCLARLQPERLKVVARTTTMHFRNTQKPAGEIARELNLDYLLAGSVRRNGERLRITAQLIKAGEDVHVWAQTYDRGLGDVLSMQAEAAAEIGAEIRLALAPRERGRPVDSEAYECFLKGRYHLNRMTPADAGTAIRWFQQAVQKYPQFALAYAGIGSAYSQLAIAPFDALPPRQAMPKAREAVEAALKIDPSLPEAHATLGVIQHHYDWEWKAAEKSYQRALELNPSYSAAYLRSAWLLLALGRAQPALKQIEAARRIAQEVDPHLLVVIGATRAAAFYFARDYDRAISECREALGLDSTYFLLHYLLGRCLARKGQLGDAVAALSKSQHAWGQIPLMDTGLALAQAVSGDKEEACRAIERLMQLAEVRYVPTTYVGMLYAGMGERDQAFTWLEKAYEERADGLTLLNVDPMVDDLRSDTRFKSLVRRIGLAE